MTSVMTGQPPSMGVGNLMRIYVKNVRFYTSVYITRDNSYSHSSHSHDSHSHRSPSHDSHSNRSPSPSHDPITVLIGRINGMIRNLGAPCFHQDRSDDIKMSQTSLLQRYDWCISRTVGLGDLHFNIGLLCPFTEVRS